MKLTIVTMGLLISTQSAFAGNYKCVSIYMADNDWNKETNSPKTYQTKALASGENETVGQNGQRRMISVSASQSNIKISLSVPEHQGAGAGSFTVMPTKNSAEDLEWTSDFSGTTSKGKTFDQNLHVTCTVDKSTH